MKARHSLGLLIAGLMVVALAGVWQRVAPQLPPPEPVRFSIAIPGDRELDAFALSAGAARLAYTAGVGGRWRLFVRGLDEMSDRPVDGAEGAHSPFFSPDGRWIAFFAQGRLKKVPADGSSPPQVICEAPTDSAGGTWTEDGRIIFAPLGGRGLIQVSPEGGPIAQVMRTEPAVGEIAHGWPHALPGSAGILFTISRRGRDARLAVLPPDGGPPKALLPVAGQGQYISSGHLVYSYLGDLFVVRFDLGRLEARGSPTSIARGIQGYRGFDELGRSAFAVTVAGTLLWLRGESGNPPSLITWVDRDGQTQPLSDTPGQYQSPRLSPDGRRLAVAVRSGMMNRDLLVLDVSRPASPLVHVQGGDNHSPAWLADGRLSYASNRDGNQDIYVLGTGGGTPRPRALLSTRGAARSPISWAAGLLAFYDIDPVRGRDIWLFRAPVTPIAVIATAANERSPSLSPDGRWLAYVSDASGRDETYVARVRDSGFGIRDSVSQEQQVSASGGVEPVWGAGGAELMYRAHDEMMAVPFDRETGRSGPAVRLFERRFEHDPGGNLPNYAAAADGRRFVMLQSTVQPRELRGGAELGDGRAPRCAAALALCGGLLQHPAGTQLGLANADDR